MAFLKISLTPGGVSVHNLHAIRSLRSLFVRFTLRIDTGYAIVILFSILILMGTRLFVGSLAWATNDDGLKAAFEQFGTVVSANVISDRMSGRSKGFGFVEMSTPEEAQAALDGMNGKELDGRPIVVNEARPREERA